MSLIDKVGAVHAHAHVWRSLFGADKQPALAEAVENVGVLRSQLPRPRRLTDAAVRLAKDVDSPPSKS